MNEDLARLRVAIPELLLLSDAAVAALYGAWSEDEHCASWLVLRDRTTDEFRRWLLADSGGEP